MKDSEKIQNSFWVRCIETQFIAMIVIVISVVVIRFCFPKTFVRLSKWYNKNILDETKISEVIREEGK